MSSVSGYQRCEVYWTTWSDMSSISRAGTACSFACLEYDDVGAQYPLFNERKCRQSTRQTRSYDQVFAVRGDNILEVAVKMTKRSGCSLPE